GRVADQHGHGLPARQSLAECVCSAHLPSPCAACAARSRGPGVSSDLSESAWAPSAPAAVSHVCFIFEDFIRIRPKHAAVVDAGTGGIRRDAAGGQPFLLSLDSRVVSVSNRRAAPEGGDGG